MSCEEKQCCSEESCSAESCCEESTGCEMTDMMLKLADEAWSELMKEKMKAAFESERGEKMDAVAKAVVNASIGKWEYKMLGKAKCNEHKEKIKQAFMD